RRGAKIVDQPDACVMFALGGTLPPARGEVVEAPVETPPPAPERPSFGVNICGHIGSEKGVGEAVRSTIRSLRTVGIPVALTNRIDAGSVNPDTEFTAFSNDNPYSVNLVHLNADAVPHFAAGQQPGYRQNRHTIGYWCWELSVFPAKWTSSFEFFDELWV